MTTDWADLPNAVHIDRVIASARAHLDHWTESWSTVQDAERAAWYKAWDAAWNEARDAVRGKARDAAWGKAWNAAYNAARDAVRGKARDAAREVARDASCKSVRDAILALIAYDDCAYMLDSDPGELAIIAKFGDTKAVLLLSACKAFHSLKEIV